MCEYFNALLYLDWLYLRGLVMSVLGDNHREFENRYVLSRLDWVTLGVL